jgi:hypothetical protein
MRLRRVDFTDVDWALLDSFADRTVFQTREWLAFIAETQRATPVVAEVMDGASRIGFFSGLTYSRFGIRMLGSAARGWSTAYMGFNLSVDVPRAELLPALKRLAFDDLACLHVEILDRSMVPADGDAFGFSHDLFNGFETDLGQSEAALFAAMSSACRRCIRKAEKSGVVIEESHDVDRFAADYYDQLKDVFLKQRLIPPYSEEQVRALCRHLLPTGRLLLLRARDPQGTCIATGIFPAMASTAYFWGNASYRRHQILRPNEALHWHAMRYWKARGVRYYDWMGAGRQRDDYKTKYGGRPIEVPWFYKSRYRTLEHLRTHARQARRLRQRVGGFLSGLLASRRVRLDSEHAIHGDSEDVT